MLKMYKLLPVVMLAFLALPGPALADSTLAAVILFNQQKAGDLTLAVLKKDGGDFQKQDVKPGQIPVPLVFKDDTGQWLDPNPVEHHHLVMVVPDGSKEASIVASFTTANRWLFGPMLTKCEARINKGTSCTVEARKDNQTHCLMILKCPGKNQAAVTN